MQQFRPDVKPPQWGPMPDVQFAVKVNAERMGIDPSAFVQYLPVWERGGVRLQDVFLNPDYVVGTDLANYRWSAYGLERTAGFADPSVGLVKPAIVGGLFTIIQQIIPSATAGRWYLSNRSEFGFQIQFNTLRVISTIRASSANVITSSINHAINQPILAAMSWDGTTFSGYSDGKLDGTTTPVTPLELQSGAMSLMGNNYNSGSIGSVGAYLHVKQILTQPQIQRLYYEPFALLMPVARPLYFDLGSVEPGTEVEGPAVITAASTISASGSKQATSPATVTASASVGMGGVKGAVAPLNIVGSISVEASGIKSTSSPATITAAAEYGASGIKTIIGLDKEGPAVITASATVGMGGVKGGVGAAVLGGDSAVEAGGVKGATGQAWFAAMGEFYAVRGPDEVEITADEIGRAVSLQARNYSAVLAKRNYTARL